MEWKIVVSDHTERAARALAALDPDIFKFNQDTNALEFRGSLVFHSMVIEWLRRPKWHYTAAIELEIAAALNEPD